MVLSVDVERWNGLNFGTVRDWTLFKHSSDLHTPEYDEARAAPEVSLLLNNQGAGDGSFVGLGERCHLLRHYTQ